jgi:hypothetical protein
VRPQTSAKADRANVKEEMLPKVSEKERIQVLEAKLKQ